MSTLPESPTVDLRRARWRVDPERSTLAFEVGHAWGLVRIRGRFTRFSGLVDLRDGETAAAELTVQADSLDTGIGLRDLHLRSGQFFAVKRHPLVRFQSSSVALDGERLRIAGTLEAGGASVAVELDAEVRQLDAALELEGTVAVNQRALGMPSPLGMIRSPTKAHVHVHLVPDA